MVVARRRLRLKPAAGDWLEHPLLWLLLFGAAWAVYRYTGRFLDFALPILGLEFGRLALNRKAGQLVRRGLTLAKVLR